MSNKWFDVNDLKYIKNSQMGVTWSQFSNLVGLGNTGVSPSSPNFIVYHTKDDSMEVLVSGGDGGNGIGYADVQRSGLFEGRYVDLNGNRYFAKLMSGKGASGGYNNSEYDFFYDKLNNYMDMFACRDKVTRGYDYGRVFDDRTLPNDLQVRGAVVLVRELNSIPIISGIVDTDYGDMTHKPNSVSFTITDSDKADIVSLEIRVDKSLINTIKSDNNTLSYTYDFAFFDSADYGEHEIVFTAKDSKNGSSSVTITLNKTKEPISHLPEDTVLIDASTSLYGIESELDYQCGKLGNFLKSNDVSVLPNDGLSTMIDKLIEKGFGKKFATGYAQVDSDYTRLKYYGGINDDTAWCARITGLKFKPSIIFIYYGYSNNCYYGSIYIDTPIVSGAFSFGSKTQYSNRESASFFGSNNSQLNPSEGVYLVPTHNSAFSGQQVRWIAFE